MSSVRRSAKSKSVFEPLESRRFFSVVSVYDFGARPNDGRDDSSAIQRAIDASSNGDTILFTAGTFDLSGLKPLPGNRTYKGENGATLKGKTREGQLLNIQTDNVTITGLTFEGGGVFLNKPRSEMNERIVFDNNVFRMNTNGANPNGITFHNGLKDSRITNNYFTGYGSHFAVYGYNYNGLTISNNEVVNAAAGFHIHGFNNSGNLLVEQNYITGAKHMGMEFQGRANGAVFQDNWFENPVLSSRAKDNEHSMAYSLILDLSSNITIKRNVVIAPQRPDGIGCRIGFEVGGDNVIVEDNYANGINHVLAMNDAAGSASVIARNNKFMNYREGPSIQFRAGNRKFDNINNGPNVNLTWSLDRGTPGRNRRFGGTSSTPPASNPPQTTPPASIPPEEEDDDSTPPTTTIPPVTNVPVTPPVVRPPAATPPPVVVAPKPLPPTKPVTLAVPGSLRAAVVKPTRVDLSWTDGSVNESGFKIERSLDGENWSQIAIVGQNVTKFANQNVPGGQTIYYRVRAYSGTQHTAYSSAAMVMTPTNGSVVTQTSPTTTTPDPVVSPVFPSPTPTSPVLTRPTRPPSLYPIGGGGFGGVTVVGK